MPFLPQIPKDKEIVSLDGASQRIDVSRRTLYNWMRDGKIDWIRTPSGNIRIVVDSLYKTEDKSSRGK